MIIVVRRCRARSSPPVGEARYDLPYRSNILAIEEMPSNKIHIADKPWTKVVEGAGDRCAAETRGQVLQRSEGELLLNDVEEAMSECSAKHVACRVHGSLNKTTAVSSCDGQPNLGR
ncbi:hypothetical protein MTO96_034665 [Rhipicephalus appendiculatus]